MLGMRSNESGRPSADCKRTLIDLIHCNIIIDTSSLVQIVTKSVSPRWLIRMVASPKMPILLERYQSEDFCPVSFVPLSKLTFLDVFRKF